MSTKSIDRRGGGERRSGADRRKRPAIGRKTGAPAVAGVAGTIASWAASEIALRYNIPIEVTAPVVGVLFAILTGIYNKVVLPWMH